MHAWTLFPPETYGPTVLSLRMSLSIITWRRRTWPVQFGNSDTSAEWITVWLSPSAWKGPQYAK